MSYAFTVSPWDFLGPNWQQMPAGMRNNNPGNIKYVGQAGALGPSANTDQGDPQAVFASPQAGIDAMRSLLARKYASGKVTPIEMIAAPGGWTPGNYQAAANVARYAGIGPNDNINFNDPNSANRFMSALMMQEHGPASKAYAALLGGGAATPPNPYAGMADGPKGQESYPVPPAPSPSIATASSDAPDSTSLGLTAQQGNDIASILAQNDPNSPHNRLMAAFQKLGQTPNSPMPYGRGGGDARSSGYDLLKALQANGLNLSQLLMKQRLG
jgi:hypothetical protein